MRGRRITAITSASQADDEGSTPFARSRILRRSGSRAAIFIGAQGIFEGPAADLRRGYRKKRGRRSDSERREARPRVVSLFLGCLSKGCFGRKTGMARPNTTEISRTEAAAKCMNIYEKADVLSLKRAAGRPTTARVRRKAVKMCRKNRDFDTACRIRPAENVLGAQKPRIHGRKVCGVDSGSGVKPVLRCSQRRS